MTKYARIEDSVAVEVFVVPEGAQLSDCFHPVVAALFTPCPDNITPNSTVDEAGAWTIAEEEPAPVPETPPVPPLTPMQLYQAFKPVERITIRASIDPIVMDFWDTYKGAEAAATLLDPNLESFTAGLHQMLELGILATEERITQIKTGVAQ